MTGLDLMLEEIAAKKKIRQQYARLKQIHKKRMNLMLKNALRK